MKYIKQVLLMILITGSLALTLKIKENLGLEETILNERKRKISKKNKQSNPQLATQPGAGTLPQQQPDLNKDPNKNPHENEKGFNMVSNSERSIAKNTGKEKQLLIADPANDPKALLSIQVFEKGQGLAIGFTIIDKAQAGNVDVSNQKKFFISSIQNDVSDANKTVIKREFNNNSSIAFYTEEATQSIYYTEDPEMKKFVKANIDLKGIKQPVFKLSIDLTSNAYARIMSYANSPDIVLKKKNESDSFFSVCHKDKFIEFNLIQKQHGQEPHGQGQQGPPQGPPGSQQGPLGSLQGPPPGSPQGPPQGPPGSQQGPLGSQQGPPPDSQQGVENKGQQGSPQGSPQGLQQGPPQGQPGSQQGPPPESPQGQQGAEKQGQQLGPQGPQGQQGPPPGLPQGQPGPK